MKKNSETSKKRREGFYRKAYKAMPEYYGVDVVSGHLIALWVFEFEAYQKWRAKLGHCDTDEKEMAVLPQLLVDECRKEKPELWCMWSLAVLYNYGPSYKYNPLPENRNESIRLLEAIRDRRDELTDSDADRVIKKLLNDWLKCIRETNVSEEIINISRMNFIDADYIDLCDFDKGGESLIFVNLPGLKMRDGYHLGQCESGENCKWLQDKSSFFFHCGSVWGRKLFVYGAKGNVYDEISDFVEADDTEIGRSSMQLLMDFKKRHNDNVLISGPLKSGQVKL